MQSSNIYIEPSRRIRPKIPGGRADLLVAMVKDRFREVGEAIGVELKSAEE